MIVCGWCGQGATDVCPNCGRDPLIPWQQRGLEAPAFDSLKAARAELTKQGINPTAEALAEFLGVSERTVRRRMSAK